MEDKKAQLLTFFSKYFHNQKIADDTDIFSLGINSLLAMELVMFLEKNFQISIGSEDMEIENFRTINNILALLDRKIPQERAVY
ncbi:acyl carrier protein [Paenibacillus sp. GbtcB18]|uniref:acyl carrier protein n=1 Tax=Paenibacillus sp. GbtcB18 TaxID=2824763 RepID=UPI001C3096B7|nr:acyl carrier protein [Paenibacillus sp. GbtcB18]